MFGGTPCLKSGIQSPKLVGSFLMSLPRKLKQMPSASLDVLQTQKIDTEPAASQSERFRGGPEAAATDRM